MNGWNRYALAKLTRIADRLYTRELKLSRLFSLLNFPDPARTEIVSFICAAGRLSIIPLTEAVTTLRDVAPDDVVGIEPGVTFSIQDCPTRSLPRAAEL